MKGGTSRNRGMKDGMTLAELVIAVGILAFSIPLMLAANGSAHQARSSSELETRSAWVASEVRQRIMNEWARPNLSETLAYPFPTEEQPMVSMEMICRKNGMLVPNQESKGETGSALFLIAIESRRYGQEGHRREESALAITSIEIQHPVEAPPNRRKRWTYQFIGGKEDW